MKHRDKLTDNPLAGHIVRFPTAIPNAQWMADRMLWADQIGAIWPFGEPTPMSGDEGDSMGSIELYREAGFFTECHVNLDNLSKEVPEALAMPPAAAREWLNSLPELDEGGAEEAFRNPRDAFFYINKLGPEVSDMLLSTGIAVPADETFIRLKSSAAARTLINAIAAQSQPVDGRNLPITLDPARDSDLAKAAAPIPSGTTFTAAVVQLPVVAARITDARQIIEFRSNPRNERARADYLNAVERYVSEQSWVESVEPHSDRAATIRRERIRQDLLSSTRALADTQRTAGLAGYAASAVSALVAVAQASEGSLAAASAAAGAAGLAASTVTLRGNRNTRYLRRANSAELFARPN